MKWKCLVLSALLCLTMLAGCGGSGDSSTVSEFETVGNPTYTMESSWLKETTGLYNDAKVWTSQRYIADVYLTEAKSGGGQIDVAFDNALFQYMGRIESDGIEATVEAVGSTLTINWKGNVDAQSERVKLVRLQFFFANVGGTLADVKAKGADTVVRFGTGSQTAGTMTAQTAANTYTGEVDPTTYPLELSSVTVDGTDLSAYKIVVKQSDANAKRVADLVNTFIHDKLGYVLSIVGDNTAAAANEIVVGGTSRLANPISDANGYKTYRDGSRFYVFFGGERSGEEAAGAFVTDIIGKSSTGYDAATRAVTVAADASVEGTYESLSRFVMMADTHVGTLPNAKSHGFVTQMYENINKQHAANPFDFVVSLGDNIDYGYDSGSGLNKESKEDYNIYLELIKGLTICDPVNPYGEKMDSSKIPHYELKGNHDPSVYTRFIGSCDSQLTPLGTVDTSLTPRENMWYVTSKSGKKTAYISAQALYAEFPRMSGTNAYGKIIDVVVDEVEANLKEAKAAGAEHIVFFCHFSLAHIDHVIDEQGRVALLKLFEEYGVETYFNGHEHANLQTALDYATMNGVYNVSVPSPHPMKVFSAKPYYGVVEIGASSMRIQWYHSMEGSLAGTTILPLN